MSFRKSSSISIKFYPHFCRSRSKRSSTFLNDGPSTPAARKKLKKTTNANDNSSLVFADQNFDLANMLVDLKNSDWTQILPTVNDKQKLVKYVNVYEQSKKLNRTSAQQKSSKTTSQNVASHAANNLHSGTSTPVAITSQAVNTLRIVPNVPSPRIEKRRNAIYRPRAKVNTVCVNKIMIPKKIKINDHISSNQLTHLLYQCKQRSQCQSLQRVQQLL